MGQVNKGQFEKFLQRCYLNKIVESFISEVTDNEISTYFKTGTGLVGEIKLKDFDVVDSEITFYNPDVILGLLKNLNSEIDIKLKKDGDGIVKVLEAQDQKGKEIKYAVQEPDLVGKLENKKPKEVYLVQINLNQELIDDILQANATLLSPSVNFVKIKNKEKVEKLYLIFGYSKNNTNQIKIELQYNGDIDDIDNISFSSSYITQILSVNSKGFIEGTLELNDKLIRIYFKDKNSEAEYFLAKLNEQGD